MWERHVFLPFLLLDVRRSRLLTKIQNLKEINKRFQHFFVEIRVPV